MIFFNFIISNFICLLFYNKFKKNNFFYFYFFIIFIFIMLVIMLQTSNVFVFFLSYEFIMLPSVMLSYYSSPNKRAKIISFYFLFWTQIGSFFFFIFIIIVYLNNITLVNNYHIFFSKYNVVILKTILFLGLGVKIPVWPFHFWLTKTHVEVNTSFSIFLSGILVKIALIAFYKFIFIFDYNNYFFVFIVLFGIIDVSFKIGSQVDYKKIVAYCTVFEMNIILLNVFFVDYNTIVYYLLFCILHTTLSSLFFFINDLIYKKYGTRVLNCVSCIINNSPIFGFLTLMCVLLFSGLPLTFKFNMEVVIFLKIISLDFLIFFVFFATQYIFIVQFIKLNYSVLFNNLPQKKISDASVTELFIFLFHITILLIL